MTGFETFTLRNENGVELRALAFGGIIMSLKTPDRRGRSEDIVLGFDDPAAYRAEHPYFGALVGRYANRIRAGRFELDGRAYQLAVNNGRNHLHGGVKGFDKFLWSARAMEEVNGVVFTRTSPDGEEGYPGTLNVRVTYTLTAASELIAEYRATTDKATPLNLTQHSYFNLTGDPSADVLGHELTLNADRYTPVDGTQIPTGELRSVQDTPFDFRQGTPIGARIEDADEQLKNGGGYDHNWVLNRKGAGLQFAARVVEPLSGRTLEIATEEPGIQFYSGNLLDGTLTGKGGQPYRRRTGFCLETQHFPDSPNQPHFPLAILRPGDEYKTTTVFRFGVTA